MKKETNLLPCPFCGKEGTIYVTKRSLSFIKDVFYPRCKTHQCVGNNGWVEFGSEDQAIEAWNRRAK